MDGEAFREAFLSANARRDFITSEFADVVRDLARAIAANDSSGAVYKASEKMKFCVDLLQRCPDPISWYSLFADSVAAIKDEIPDDLDERRYIDAARRGTKYLVEISASDGFAAARASKAYDSFVDAFRRAEESRRH